MLTGNVNVNQPAPAEYVFDFSLSDGSQFHYQESAPTEVIAIEQLLKTLEDYMTELQNSLINSPL